VDPASYVFTDEVIADVKQQAMAQAVQAGFEGTLEEFEDATFSDIDAFREHMPYDEDIFRDREHYEEYI
jgi:hypothetical protein